MKNRARSAAPRRETSPEKQVQLPLRPRRASEPGFDENERRSGPFWKWVGIIALLHLILLVSVGIFYAAKPKPPVPEPEKQFFSLLPKGSAVHGNPGESQSPTPKPVEPTPVAVAPQPPPARPTPPEIAPPKPTPPPPTPPEPVAVKPKPPIEPPTPVKPPTPPKPKVAHTPPKPKPKPEPPKPPKPIVKEVKPTPPVVKPPPEPEPEKPIVKEVAPPTPDKLLPPPDPEPVKPVAKEETKPAPKKPKPEEPPAKPKVKLAKNDLQLADAPDSEPAEKPTTAKSSTAKKEKAKPAPSESASAEHDKPAAPEKPGPTAAEIAAKFGAKLQAAGVKDSVKVGTSGSLQTPKENPYAGFYASVRDQVMNKWEHPNLTDETAINPVVTIHVEKDGRVPPEGVFLSRSSGNQAYDDSAVAAAKRLGFTLQPLPEGCPPDIHITFKLTR